MFATTRGRVHIQRDGLYVRRSRLTRLESFAGLPMVTAAECLLELAVDLSLVDLVPLVDIALRARHCTLDQAWTAASSRRPGAANLRSALQLSDPRSESAWESILRLVHVTSGLSDVVSQHVITDETGASVARADLWLVGTRRLHEYDGADHREARQHQRDLARDKALARLAYERYGYTAAEIVRRPGQIIADAEQAFGLPHDPRRHRRWLAAAAESTLTPRGRLRLSRRLERYSNTHIRGKPQPPP